ncbi:MAG: SDR family NAD(P)-dependent oxidoreductase [Pseudomonadota bacterium]
MSKRFLRSKNILITGGTSGIGYELLRQLHADNSVSVIGRASAGLDKLKAEFAGITVYEADLSQTDEVARAADQIVKAGHALDVLINNAAVQHTPWFLDDDFCVETIEREINVNLAAPAILTYLTLPVLLQSEQAIVLNINSGLGLVPKTSSAVYCATKGGLNLLSQALRNQLEEGGVRVMQAFLPLVDTEMTRGRGAGKISADEAVERILAGMQGKHHDIDVGKVKLLRFLMRLSPAIARNIMRRG